MAVVAGQVGVGHGDHGAKDKVVGREGAPVVRGGVLEALVPLARLDEGDEGAEALEAGLQARAVGGQPGAEQGGVVAEAGGAALAGAAAQLGRPAGVRVGREHQLLEVAAEVGLVAQRLGLGHGRAAGAAEHVGVVVVGLHGEPKVAQHDLRPRVAEGAQRRVGRLLGVARVVQPDVGGVAVHVADGLPAGHGMGPVDGGGRVAADGVARGHVVGRRRRVARVQPRERAAELGDDVPDEGLGDAPLGALVLHDEVVERAAVVVLVEERGAEVGVAERRVARPVHLGGVQLDEGQRRRGGLRQPQGQAALDERVAQRAELDLGRHGLLLVGRLHPPRQPLELLDDDQLVRPVDRGKEPDADLVVALEPAEEEEAAGPLAQVARRGVVRVLAELLPLLGFRVSQGVVHDGVRVRRHGGDGV